MTSCHRLKIKCSSHKEILKLCDKNNICDFLPQNISTIVVAKLCAIANSSKQALYQPYKRMDKTINSKDMVRQAIEERQKREYHIKRIKSSTVIQSCYRAHVVRCRLREELKKEIDVKLNKSVESIPKLFCLVTKFFYAYQLERKFDKTDDYNSRLLLISMQMLKNGKEIGEEIVKNMTNDKISMIYMVSSIKKVLTLCIRFISLDASQQDASMDVPLQMIKYFTCLNTYLRGQSSNEVKDHSFDIVTNIVDHLFNNEYYLALIENRLQMATVETQNGFVNDILFFDNISYLQRNTRSPFYQRIILKLFFQPLNYESKKYLLMNLTNLSFPYTEMLEYLSVMELNQLTSVQVLNLFYCLLSLAEPHYAHMRFNDICNYFKIIADIINRLHENIDSNDITNEEDLEHEKMNCIAHDETNEDADDLLMEMCFDWFGNNRGLSNRLKELFGLFGCLLTSENISHLCQIYYNLTMKSRKNLSHYSFFDDLGGSSIFIGKLREVLNNPKEFSSFSKISSKTDLQLFYTFYNTFKYHLATLTDDHLLENINMESCIKPFDGMLDISSSALTIVDCCLQMNFVICSNYDNSTELKRLFEESKHFVKCLYDLDSKIKFMNDKIWGVHLLPRLVIRPIGKQYEYLQKDKRYDLLRDGLMISEELPFVFTFESRFEFFRNNAKNKLNEHRPISGVKFFRRNHIYEDAFRAIQKDKEFDLEKKYVIKFLNVLGHEESFNLYYGPMKETLHGVVTTGFNPDFGLFKETSERCLYPDPSSEFSREDYLEHYYFLGMILGKAIMENLNYNLPFASFFLIKLLSKDSDELNFHHMSSLDPVLYKNLLYLRDTDDVESMELYFNLEYDVQGSLKTVDLKPNGSNILVDDSNKQEYINLFAAWHLNERIGKQCTAFKNGLDSFISIDKLRLFNHDELQFIISGGNVPIDIEDLKKHTVYERNSDTIFPQVFENFWSVVGEMTETQKEDLLKFVTSNRRCPPFGFKTLDPSFKIEIWRDRSNNFSTTCLPKSATCTNKLFLPPYENREILKESLLKAITPGFEESILNHNLQ